MSKLVVMTLSKGDILTNRGGVGDRWDAGGLPAGCRLGADVQRM